MTKKCKIAIVLAGLCSQRRLLLTFCIMRYEGPEWGREEISIISRTISIWRLKFSLKTGIWIQIQDRLCAITSRRYPIMCEKDLKSYRARRACIKVNLNDPLIFSIRFKNLKKMFIHLLTKIFSSPPPQTI
jgi:hypothetical protein